MARTPPRRADEWARWLRANGHNLAPVTGTDYRVLEALDALWACLVVCNENIILAAATLLLMQMQAKNWHLARELIARSLDWGDRDRLWSKLPDDLRMREFPNSEFGGRHG